MRVLFWGTPDFAVPSLRALLGEGHQVVGVVTQPDRPAGRGRKLRPSPVKELALSEDLPVLTPEQARGPAFREALEELDPELSVVVAYGHILAREILELPPSGSVNVHASLLPRLRGAAPVNWALIRGHEETGITVMRMTQEMDEGPILLQRAIPIAPEDSATGLYLRLAELGAEALIEALALMEAGLLDAREQDHDAATYAPKLDRSAARIDWDRPATELANHIRGMDMVPGAWTLLDDLPVKLFTARPVRLDAGARTAGSEPAPGEILVADPDDGLVVATAGPDLLTVEEVQPAGKRRMPVADWLRGGGPRVGERFR